jgi:hypothetical protein
MVVYEVTAVVAPELRESFERYMLDKHIAAVLATGKFAEALFESSGSGIYRTRYVAEDRERTTQMDSGEIFRNTFRRELS